MLRVFFLRRKIHKDIVHKHHHKSVQVGSEDAVHEVHESDRDICQTKGHDHELVMFVLSAKRCLLDVGVLHPQLMISRSKVNSRKASDTCS